MLALIMIKFVDEVNDLRMWYDKVKEKQGVWFMGIAHKIKDTKIIRQYK